jgi:flagellar biosynthesis chaperone FliJ
MGELLASRMILDTQRHNITHNKEWINFAQKQSNYAKEVLKKNMIEYEKFKYLELEEIKRALKAQKIQESKELDEIALLTHSKKHK